MQRISTLEVRAHTGERVYVKGWLQSLRQMGGINFLVLRDGWGTLQAVAETGPKSRHWKRARRVSKA